MPNRSKDASSMARRRFLQLSAVTVATASTVGSSPTQAAQSRASAPEKRARSSRTAKGEFRTQYSGADLNRVAFPMGGLGAGMICLEGTGALSHVSLRNKPEVFNEPLMFA